MKIQFCGAAREVTGSCHLLTLDDGFKILLDCGLYQGGNEKMADFNEKWLFNPAEINCLVVSHAHIDHTGRIPKLVADGFKGTIFSTLATRDLCAIMLLDSAKIQESDADHRQRHAPTEGDDEDAGPLYEVEDVQKAMKLFVGYNYEQTFRPHPKVRGVFRDAGHILGSASVCLEIETKNGLKRLAFTGDIGRPNRPILGDPTPMPHADFIISESTYGDRLHEAAPNEMERFVEIVHRTCVEKQGKLLIPAFAVGRTQEIVFMLDQMEKAGRLPRIPVFVDSPLAVNATEVFINHPECFDSELHRYLVDDENAFGFKNLHYLRTAEESKRLNSLDGGAIIIATSGMLNAGRIKHHLANCIENPRNTLLIVGYCSPNTPGGQLRDGAKQLNLFGEWKDVRLEVEIMDSFSAHGDQAEMFAVLKNQKESAQRVFLVHGELEKQTVWRDFLLKNGFRSVEIPELGAVVEL